MPKLTKKLNLVLSDNKADEGTPIKITCEIAAWQAQLAKEGKALSSDQLCDWLAEQFRRINEVNYVIGRLCRRLEGREDVEKHLAAEARRLESLLGKLRSRAPRKRSRHRNSPAS